MQDSIHWYFYLLFQEESQQLEVGSQTQFGVVTFIFFSLIFFIFSFPLWVAITSLTEVWCAHMGIITLFGMVCVEQACKYGQERSCCVDLCEQNKFVSWVLLGRYLNWFFTTNSYKQSVL